jgi:hypothetical protein
VLLVPLAISLISTTRMLSGKRGNKILHYVNFSTPYSVYFFYIKLLFQNMSCQLHEDTESVTGMEKETGAVRRSNILEFYEGARVLVSGGTGFMGQVLIEKLLRTCQIEKLYLIVRPKKGLTEKERVEKMFGGVVSELCVCYCEGCNCVCYCEGCNCVLL